MTSADHEPAGIVRIAGGSGKFERAFLRLAQAYSYSQDAHCSAWEFAVEIESLVADGLTNSDLRWLVNQGYVEHAVEITRRCDCSRRFQPWWNLGFSKRTCFVLSEPGRHLLPLLPPHMRPFPPDLPPSECDANRGQVPLWNHDRRVLCVGDVVVKRFRVPSPNQETILAAFQEEAWPTAIDDPLPCPAGRDSKRRLRSTVQSLNANQKNRLLRFRGDGTGTRVLWELMSNGWPQSARQA